MKPAILLVDLQNDFLRAAGLEPAPGPLIERATRLLDGARACGIPIIHVWTSVRRDADRRMPHWQRNNLWRCEVGTAGHATPPTLQPLAGEPIIHKTFFSAFGTGELDRVLESLNVDTLLLAGVHMHGCVRATALDAYQRGYKVWVAGDAVASDDPLHAAITQRYLETRAARFATVESCLTALLNGQSLAAPAELSHVSSATTAARRAFHDGRLVQQSNRCAWMDKLAGLLEAETESLARAIVSEVSKPLTLSRSELQRTVALLRVVRQQAQTPSETRCTADSVRRQRPHGVVGVVTPWNNPVAIPLGKILPALAFGNAVVWKPSPAGAGIAARLMQLLRFAGCPDGAVNLVNGDGATARALMASADVDAVTITGSPAAGNAALEICGRRHIPLQAELGGNNAAIVWADADVLRAATAVADTAFAFAGQRCTANRRVIVDTRICDRFVESVSAATAALAMGDPLDETTRVGPLISQGKCREVAAVVERARVAAAKVLAPHRAKVEGAFFPPTIICCDDPTHEVVQEETFGPVLVVQRAADWKHALELCNDVRQGLVASVFTASRELQEQFLESARAGILKINRATADANVEAPFGGWKASGIGPPEHGAGNREFYTRAQAVYRDDA